MCYLPAMHLIIKPWWLLLNCMILFSRSISDLFQIIITYILLYIQIGLSSLLSASLMITLCPLQYFIGRKLSRFLARALVSSSSHSVILFVRYDMPTYYRAHGAFLSNRIHDILHDNASQYMDSTSWISFTILLEKIVLHWCHGRWI